MKYYKTSKFPKAVGTAGFYTIIAICIMAIGAISWFAVSRYNAVSEEPKPQGSVQSVPTEPQTDTVPEEQTQPEPEQDKTVETEAETSEVPYSEEADKKENTVFTMPVSGEILKGYSDTALQYSATYSDMRLHTAIDIKAAAGADIKSAAAGTVTQTENSSELGKCITIDHGDGITVKYCGFDTLSVSDGEKVTAGTVIGRLGTIPSECAEESHLHIEVKKDGKIVSPLTVLGVKR